jgi:endonuclease YncB( thermonuclease family)
MDGETVEVQQVDKDRCGRVVANDYVGGTLVNWEQVAKGLAWRYVQYDKKGELTQVEQAAKTAHKGLWADAHPVPPRESRKSEKER